MIMQGILVPAVREEECFSFCMCNPPFFGSLQEAGRNPHTAYAGNGQAACPQPSSSACSTLQEVSHMLFELRE